jgi:hypothetical protein
VQAVGAYCLCPGEVPLCFECFPIWHAARKLHFHVHTPNNVAATDPAPLPAPRNRKRTHAEQQQPSSARAVTADQSRSGGKSAAAGLDAQGSGDTAAAEDGERPLKKRRLPAAGGAAPCCVGGDAAACGASRHVYRAPLLEPGVPEASAQSVHTALGCRQALV